MGDAKAGSRSTRAGAKRTSIRRRAVGTRDRIISHLAAIHEISDPAGMASTRLAEAVGYPGSSVAFAQLLSGMERDGLIIREIRGKRTYRISLPEGAAAEPTARPAAVGGGRYAAEPGTGLASMAPAGGWHSEGRSAATGTAGLDYDELARRLLVQVVRRLATPRPNVAGELATVDAPGALAESVSDAEAREAGPRDGNAPGEEPFRVQEPVSGDRERAALQQTVAGLERELATAWSRHGTLTAENARLREQLNQAQRDLARERTRRAQITSELNQAEVVLLERLLAPATDNGEEHTDVAAN